ncbi:unnamed protein product [Linum tenue]|uniref:Uncharacterized protein n=1 Tax=Linum tenue TaxID=586396 RepID=A0AAV0I528_9ROSI|nr:unnamed protein product [Linum tenue]
MRTPRNWFSKVGRKLLSPSRRRRDVVLHSNASSRSHHDDLTTACHNIVMDNSQGCSLPSNTQHAAALKIQATFRGHLARRAFGALRSLVKVQAVARGAYARRQSQLALNCMRALVRLQVRIKARQLLGPSTT